MNSVIAKRVIDYSSRNQSEHKVRAFAEVTGELVDALSDLSPARKAQIHTPLISKVQPGTRSRAIPARHVQRKLSGSENILKLQAGSPSGFNYE